MIVSVYLPTFKLCKYNKMTFLWMHIPLFASVRQAETCVLWKRILLVYTSHRQLLKLASLQIVQPLLSYSWPRYLTISIAQLHCTNTRDCTFLYTLLCHSHNIFKVFFMCIIFILSCIVFLQNLMQHNYTSAKCLFYDFYCLLLPCWKPKDFLADCWKGKNTQ